MGVIQNTINQALGTIGLAARLSPQLEQKALKKANEKERADIIDTTKKLAAETPNIEERLLQEEALDLPTRRIEMLKESSRLGIQKPSEAAEGILQQQKQMGLTKAIKENKAKIHVFDDAERAAFIRQLQMKRAGSIQANQKTQKDDFKKYPDDLKKTIALLKGRDITNE